jgi:hypothetical protein
MIVHIIVIYSVYALSASNGDAWWQLLAVELEGACGLEILIWCTLLLCVVSSSSSRNLGQSLLSG